MRASPVRAALILAALAAAAPWAPAQDKEKPLPSLAAVLPELQRGGLVIYFRHAATDPTGAKDDVADLARCQTQRNLSAEGRKQASGIGKAMRDLRIPIGAVASSPFCRCKDTAQLAFGKFAVERDLFFAIHAGAAETARLSVALRRMLATPPAAGTNAVIVAHTANLREAAGIWPKPEGAAYVFRPLPGGGFEPVARVAPEDWAAAAARR
jgi:broad specificity phosphatase PhoE